MREMEYKVILDTSLGNNNNEKAVAKRINKLANEGFKVVSSCAFNAKNWSNIYVIMEREKQ